MADADNNKLVELTSLEAFDKNIKAAGRETMQEAIEEARRQVEVCNACRYCESYCAVFPAINRQSNNRQSDSWNNKGNSKGNDEGNGNDNAKGRDNRGPFTDGNITQLANLCHNCRGCYYACQYIPPHEFAINFPRALAEVRHQSWKGFAWPKIKGINLASWFDRSGMLITIFLTLSLAFIFFIAQALKPESGAGFYAYMSHGLMVSIFLPSFLLPLLAVGFSLRSYWRAVGEPGENTKLKLADILSALSSAAKLKNLDGGHGDGCNYEDQDRFSQFRRWMHHLTFYGFMLCFASTTSGAILHTIFKIEGPYGLLSAPKLFGVPGGVMLCVGTAGLAWLKTKADKNLGVPNIWGGEMAFTLLLFSVSFTGLLLFLAPYWTMTAGWVGLLLPIHLGTVLAFFLLTPYSKMIHGFYRMAALVKDAAIIRESKQRK